MRRLAFTPLSDARLPQVLDLMRGYYEYDNLVFDEGHAGEALAGLLASPHLGHVLVLELDRRPIGYIALTFSYSLEWHGKDVFVDEFFILEEHRGKGIGQKALQYAEEYSRSLGIRSLHLGVEKSNLRARAFYGRAGYPDVGRSLLSKRLI